MLADTIAPTTTLDDLPGDGSSTTARFTFAGSDNRTSESSLRFQCRIDSAAWTACTSPASYPDLDAGSHTFDVRATDEAGNSGAPATHAWTISAPATCPERSVAPADGDSWIDQNSGFTNKGTDSILKLQSKGPADNFRLVVRFGLDFEALPAGCSVASATLRLYAASFTPGRRLDALRLDSPWSEEVVAWRSEPWTTGAAAVTTSDSGYRSWNVTSQVRAVQAGAANHGFLIRDAAEDELGEAQSFHSREKGDNPPELVMTFAPAASPDGVVPETTIESGPGSSGPSATFTFSARRR